MEILMNALANLVKTVANVSINRFLMMVEGGFVIAHPVGQELTAQRWLMSVFRIRVASLVFVMI
jgi:hypothetical protein